jgi:hypothetical protein
MSNFRMSNSMNFELSHRKLEEDIQELGYQGLEAPRSGGQTKLKAKLEGLSFNSDLPS